MSVGYIFILWWIEGEAHMYAFPTNTKPKSDSIFNGLFCYRRMMELHSCSVY